MPTRKDDIMRTQFYDFLEDLTNIFAEAQENKSFPLDVTKTKEGYKVVAEIPGFSKEDFNIEFEKGTLTITAERKENKENENIKYLLKERTNSKMRREINFGDINEESLSAKYENGLLIVNLTVKEQDKTKKSITIE